MSAVAPAHGVAVHRLNPRHRDDIDRHLLLLPAEDRRLRFGQHIRDDAVRDYVGRIDFECELVESGETDARLTLDRGMHGGALKEAMADQFALVDCMLKQQYLWLTRPKSAGHVPAGEHREGAIAGFA